MDAYTFSLALGGAGLIAMAIGGFAAHGHADGAHGHAGHSDAGHVGHGDTAHSIHDASGHHMVPHAAVHHGTSHTMGGAVRSALLALASPRVIFSFLVGFGLTGLALRHVLGGPIQLAVAAVGGIAFETLLIAPTWRFLFRFASTPAASLEGALLSEARAASGFDTNGQGLVALEVDGQIVQCLGTLRDDDRALGVRVRSGDLLRVEDIDAARNRCTVAFVSRQVAAP